MCGFVYDSSNAGYQPHLSSHKHSGGPTSHKITHTYSGANHLWMKFFSLSERAEKKYTQFCDHNRNILERVTDMSVRQQRRVSLLPHAWCAFCAYGCNSLICVGSIVMLRFTARDWVQWCVFVSVYFQAICTHTQEFTHFLTCSYLLGH